MPHSKIAVGFIRRKPFVAVLVLSCIVAMITSAKPAFAQQNNLPVAQLTSIFPFGGKIGASVDVTLAGPDLDDLTGLHFSHPGITAQPRSSQPTAAEPAAALGNKESGKGKNKGGKAGGSAVAVPLAFTVNIGSDVPSGIYEVRAVGRYGISNPRMFLVDQRAFVTESGSGSTLEMAQTLLLDTNVFGALGAEKSDYYKFQAKAGQRILVECWAHRSDSKADATLVLFDTNGRELQRNNDTYRRDPLIDFTASADGTYSIQIFDFLYRGGSNDYGYRLTATTAPIIDFVFPPSGVPGSKGTYTLFGRNLPGGTKTEQKTLDGRFLEKLDVQIELPSDVNQRLQMPMMSLVEPQDAGLDAFQYKLSTPQGDSNPIPIYYASAPVVAEQEPNNSADKAQPVTLPCEIVGQFSPRADQDWFTFDAKKGQTLFLEVYSERMGLVTDAYLRVQRVTKNDKGVEVVADVVELDDPKLLPQDQRQTANFDMSSGDMSYKLIVPDDGTYRVLIRDLYYQSRGSANYLYRLAIRDPAPDFRLVAVSEPPVNPQNNNVSQLWSTLLHRGGTQAVKVYVVRQDDFDGEIQLSVEGLPTGLTCPAVTIGPKAPFAQLVFNAADDAPGWSGTVRVLGKAKLNDAEITREARGGTLVWGSQNRDQNPIRSRMTGNVALAVTDKETAAARIDVGTGQTFETSLAGKLEIPVKVTRRGEFKGNLKLTSPGMPKDMKFADLDLAGGEGKLTLDIKNTAAPGTYSFTLQASTQIPNYRRNAEGADAAQKLAKEMEQAATDAANAVKAATQAKADAEKAATESAAAAKLAADALAASTKALQQSETNLKGANEQLDAAKKAAEAKPDDQGLQSKKTELEKAAADAAEKLRIAAEAKSGSERGATEMTSKVQSSAEAKSSADAALAEAAARKAQVDVERAAADKRAKEMAEASKPKNVNTTIYTMPVTVKITPAPITIASTATTTVLKPNDKVELPININRLYGFADTVAISLVSPDPAIGIKAADATIAKDQPSGKLMLEVGPKAKPGEHTLTVRAKLTLNGQPLQVDQPLVVKIEAPAEAAK